MCLPVSLSIHLSICLSTYPCIYLSNLLNLLSNPCFKTGFAKEQKPVWTWCCFYHFHLDMCFAPQRRALFHHLSFQKCSGAAEMCFPPHNRHNRALLAHLNCKECSRTEALCTFWLVLCTTTPCLLKVLRATTACAFSNVSTSESTPNRLCFYHFDLDMWFASQPRALFFWTLNISTSTSALPLRYLSILTPTCAPRNNGMQFFNSHLTKWLRAALAILLFDPLEPQSIGKTRGFATCLPFRTPWSSFY